MTDGLPDGQIGQATRRTDMPTCEQHDTVTATSVFWYAPADLGGLDIKLFLCDECLTLFREQADGEIIDIIAIPVAA